MPEFGQTGMSAFNVWIFNLFNPQRTSKCQPLWSDFGIVSVTRMLIG